MRSVCVPFFKLVRRGAVLSTAVSACSALHDAARVDAGIFAADVRTDTLRHNAVDIVSGDAALYTIGMVLSFYCR